MMHMKLYIWGTGCGAGDLADHGLDISQVCAFLDSAPVSDSFLGRPVLRPEEVKNRDIDLILVASRHVDDIAQKAAELGIGADKLVFLKGNWRLTDRNRGYSAAEKILRTDYLDIVRAPQHAVRDPLWVQDSPLTPRDLENDYVRMRTLEALCRELDDVPGAAAELGVYRGGFAQCLNALLPERTLYLFDTFEGFPEEDVAIEQAQGLSRAKVGDFSETAQAIVEERLPHPEKAVFHKGYFPNTFRPCMEERFAFVSVDADLYAPTAAALPLFWAQLSPGGALLIHDVNSTQFTGAGKAVREFCREKALLPTPVCDLHGSVILRKPL